MILSTFLYPPTSNSEPVHLDGGPGDTFFSKEGEYLGPLITLELDDLAHLFVLDEGAVAGEFLLECLQELLSVVLLWQALQRRQRFTPIPLLDTDMDVIRLRPDIQACAKRVGLVGERVKGGKVLHAHATRGNKDKKLSGG